MDDGSEFTGERCAKSVELGSMWHRRHCVPSADVEVLWSGTAPTLRESSSCISAVVLYSFHLEF